MADATTVGAVGQPVDELRGEVAGRFVVGERLGRGAMGEVYRARDNKLKRTVALKRMSSQLRADPQSRERFVKEAERASQLSDRNIAGIYDVVEDKGELFLVMEYVEGETLRERLKRPLSLQEFLPTALQCAGALAAAHAHGIVHFDVKPENIMLTPSGQVKMLDFGLARHFPRPDESTMSVSELRNVGGTMGYTAPEVMCGQSVDERADVFSLGVVFYELLTGVRPFVADSPMGVADKVLHDLPVPLRHVKPAIPLELERITNKMLQRNPQARHANAGEVLADLRQASAAWAHPWRLIRHLARLHWKVWAASFVAAVVVASAIWFVRRVPPVPPKKNLVVLPFHTTNGDGSKAAFAYGLAEMLSAKLAQLSERHRLVVVAPGEVRAQQVTSADEALRAFGANLVLEGSMRQSGTSVRVTYSLVDTRSGQQLRADTITADASDPFAVEDRVAKSVLESLELELGKTEEQKFLAHGTAEPAAYDFYLQGRGYLQDYHKPENLESAITVFQHALERDPKYALAYAGLGEAYWRSYELSHDKQWVEKALAACQKSVLLAPDSADGHICIGTAFNGTGKYELAAEQFQQAMRLNPTDDAAYRGLAAAYERLQKPVEAEQAYKEALQLRPEYWGVYNYLGLFYWKHGRYHDAEEMFSHVVRLEPDNVRGYNNLGAMLLLQGRYAEAVPVFQHSASIRPSADVYSNLATAYFYLHRFDEAAQAYEQAAKLDPHDHRIQGNLGELYYRSPDKRDAAVNAYRQAVALTLEEARVNPRDASLFGDLARYEAILGDRAAALKYLKRGLELSPADPELLYQAALVHHQFGETAQALDWLERSLKAGYSVASVRDDPFFADLHNQPRFQQLVETKDPEATATRKPTER